MKPDTHKTYPHVTGLHGDGGENPAVLAVTAILDPSIFYPEEGRIIVGSPTKSPELEGYIPDLGGFSCGVAGAERLVTTLQHAISDVRAATGRALRGSEVWEEPPFLRGFNRIGRIDAVGRRSLWLKEENGAFELRAGREGDDAHVRVTAENPQFQDLENVMSAARFAAEWEDRNGFGIDPLGVEKRGYECPTDPVSDPLVDNMPPTTVYLLTIEHDDIGHRPFRVIVRHASHFAVQYLRGGADVPFQPYWDSVTKENTGGVTADYVLSIALAALGRLATTGEMALKVVENGVTTIDLGVLRP